MNRNALRNLVHNVVTGAAFVCAALFAGHALAATDVNQANQAELESVKGIGPGLAGKILKAREAGTFKDWGDLVDRVGGVGPGNAPRLSQAGLTVAGSGYAPQPAGAQLKPAARAKADRPDGAPSPAAKSERTRKSKAGEANATTSAT